MSSWREPSLIVVDASGIIAGAVIPYGRLEKRAGK